MTSSSVEELKLQPVVATTEGKEKGGGQEKQKNKEQQQDDVPYDYISFSADSLIHCRNRPWYLSILAILILTCFGFFQGFAFGSCGIVDPHALYGQMIFGMPGSCWIVMKLFLSGMGSSMFFGGVVELLAPAFFRETRDVFSKERLAVDPGWIRQIIGGVLVGIGLAFGGGTTIIPSQLAFSPSAVWPAAVGVFSGGLVWAILDKIFVLDDWKECHECEASVSWSASPRENKMKKKLLIKNNNNNNGTTNSNSSKEEEGGSAEEKKKKNDDDVELKQEDVKNNNETPNEVSAINVGGVDDHHIVSPKEGEEEEGKKYQQQQQQQEQVTKGGEEKEEKQNGKEKAVVVVGDAKTSASSEGAPPRVLEEVFSTRFWKLAIPGGLFIFGFACVLEFVIVTKEFDQERLHVGKLYWPAIAAGAIIGMNQVAYMILGSQTQSGTSSMLVVFSVITNGWLAPHHFPNDCKMLFSLFFVWLGSPLGSFTAKQVHPESHSAPGFPVWRSFLAGLLSSFGARVSLVGCTCASGISGSGFMDILAFLTTAATFGGAIATGFIIYGIETME